MICREHNEYDPNCQVCYLEVGGPETLTPFGCDLHKYCFRNRQDCEFDKPVTVPVTDFADKVIDDPEKLKQRIYQLEQALSQIKEFAKVVDQ